MYFSQCTPPCKFQFKFSYCCGLKITAGEWTMSGQDDNLITEERTDKNRRSDYI